MRHLKIQLVLFINQAKSNCFYFLHKLKLMNFNHKIIWITGASSGIGKSLANALSKEQTKLILSSRNKTDLNAVKNECKHPKIVSVLTLDLEDYINFSSKMIQKLLVT